MTDKKYKLTYFPIKLRAECIRYLFALANCEYEEELIQFADWEEYKPKTQFGVLPMLEVDDKFRISQTVAIFRYLAKNLGFDGKNSKERAQIDMLVDGMATTVYPKLTMKHFSGTPEEKKDLHESLTEEVLKPTLKRYEEFIAESASGWFVGKERTYADVYIAEMLKKIEDFFCPGLLDEYPKLKEFCERFHEDENIKKYLENRPDYPF